MFQLNLFQNNNDVLPTVSSSVASTTTTQPLSLNTVQPQATSTPRPLSPGKQLRQNFVLISKAYRYIPIYIGRGPSIALSSLHWLVSALKKLFFIQWSIYLKRSKCVGGGGKVWLVGGGEGYGRRSLLYSIVPKWHKRSENQVNGDYSLKWSTLCIENIPHPNQGEF